MAGKSLFSDKEFSDVQVLLDVLFALQDDKLKELGMLTSSDPSDLFLQSPVTKSTFVLH